MAKKGPYTSELTDKEWEIIRRILPIQGKLGRPPRYHRRSVVSAIFYVTRSGCCWRDMPKDFPHWRLVYYYFAKWHKMGVWQRMNDALRDQVRVKSGKKKPQRLRPLTARALKWLASEESVVSMQEKRSWDENDIFWWIPLG